MSATGYAYPLPQPDAETKGWWDALRRHELVIQECAACQRLRHPPHSVCPACGSEERTWRTMNGTATLYSYVVVHRPTLPSWRESVPYNIAVVTLDDAPEIRLHGNVVDVDDDELAIGLPLVAVFDDVTADDTLLRWRPRHDDATTRGA